MYKEMIIYLLDGIKNKKDFEVFTMVLYKCISNKDICINELNEILYKLTKLDMEGKMWKN